MRKCSFCFGCGEKHRRTQPAAWGATRSAGGECRRRLLRPALARGAVGHVEHWHPAVRTSARPLVGALSAARQREPLSSVLGGTTRPRCAPASPVTAASESSINAVLARDCPRVNAGPGVMGPKAGCSFCTHCVRLPLTSHKE